MQNSASIAWRDGLLCACWASEAGTGVFMITRCCAGIMFSAKQAQDLGLGRPRS
jgi:hypothetical protein